MSEEQLLTAVTDALTLYGYRWVHFRRSDKAQMMGHAGFPDVVAARAGRILFLELKAERGTVGVEQMAWLINIAPWGLGLDRMRAGLAAALVRPADLDRFLKDIA